MTSSEPCKENAAYLTPVSLVVALLALGVAVGPPVFASGEDESKNEKTTSQEAPVESYEEKIPGTAITFEMRPVPAGTMTVETDDGTEEVKVGPFWIGTTEVSWDAYDVYVYGLGDDEGISEEEADTYTKPSRPYWIPGESFGHEGLPALGMRFKMAQSYVNWLSAKTDRKYRLMTEAEWEHVCRTSWSGQSKPDNLDEYVWHKGNSESKTHDVDSLNPDDHLGLYHILGNAAEWVTVNGDEGAIKGGSWQTPPGEISCSWRDTYDRSWQAGDPQIPKSESWLASAPFVGMRIIRVPDDQ
jgi:formylglycine-generating enzyme required for sulfatase activity